MKNQSYYGAFPQTTTSTEVDVVAEEISRNGFFVKDGLLDREICNDLLYWSERENTQKTSCYGAELLVRLKESNTIRIPMTKNKAFFDLVILNPWLITLLDQLFSKTLSYYCLNQQNVILNQPESLHNQTVWHRDLPYQSGINSIPNAYSVLVTLTDFSMENGGTTLVPGTHLYGELPSWSYIEKHKKQITCPAGSLIVFDSLLLHKAGENRSNSQRVAVNNVFTLPTFQQQISIPAALSEAGADWVNTLTNRHRQLLGFASKSFNSEDEFLSSKVERLASHPIAN